MNSQIENFHKSVKLLPNKSLVLQNADPIIHSLNNTNEKSLPNLLQHISFRHYILKSKLSSIVGFAFQVGKKSIRLFNNCTTQGGGGVEKTNGWFTYSKVSLKTAIIDFVENFYCNVEKVIMKQSMDITVHHFLQTFFYILIKNNKCHH